MHRLIGRSALFTTTTLVAVLGLGVGCGNSKPAENASGSTDSASDKSADKKSGDDTASSGSGADGGAEGTSGGGEKKDECVGFDIGNLEDMLLKSSCEEPSVKPDSISPVDLKGKLLVTVSASPTKSAGGGKVDLLVTFANKSKEPLTLHFKLDPVPRFELEVYDVKKGKRADMPAPPTPPPPKGATQPPPSEAKSAKITIAPNGTARAHALGSGEDEVGAREVPRHPARARLSACARRPLGEGEIQRQGDDPPGRCLRGRRSRDDGTEGRDRSREVT